MQAQIALHTSLFCVTWH